jgi:hypothetical protein
LGAKEAVCSRCLGVGLHVELGVVDFCRDAFFTDPGAAAAGAAHMTSALHGIETLILGGIFHRYLPQFPHRFSLFRGEGQEFRHVRVATLQIGHYAGLIKMAYIKANVGCSLKIEFDKGASKTMELKAQRPEGEFFGSYIKRVRPSGTNGNEIRMALIERKEGVITGAAAEELDRKMRWENV